MVENGTTASANGIQGQLIWSPSDVPSTSMDVFRRTINDRFSLNLGTYDELWEWSCANLNDFWTAVWDHTGVISSIKADQAIADNAPIYPPPLWFQGARLNFAENLLRHGSPTAPTSSSSRIAVIQSTEVDTTTGELEESSITYGQLYALTSRAAAALRSLGVGINDCIASYSANNIENLVAFLAASSIGAVWTSAAADFGPEGVLERLRTVRPKVLFSVNAVRYNGKVHDHLAKLKGVVRGWRKEGRRTSRGTSGAPGMTSSPGSVESQLHFEQLDFNHPLWILFSSGTTGKPKAITHRAGGMLLQLSKEHLIHGGLTPDDVFFQHTTTGWMIAVDFGRKVWRYNIRHFAAYLGALEKSGYQVKANHSNLKVRQLLSTGSPLRAELYPYIHETIGSDILIGSITGGTDLCSLFAGHNTALPVRAGEIQARNLGMNIAVYDSDSGTEVTAPIRDGILNPGGIRFGSSEIYELLESPENPLATSIVDSLVVALKTPTGDDEVVCLFLVLSPNIRIDLEGFKKTLVSLIRTKRSARHVPKFIEMVSDIPKTLNGKKVEVPVKKIINGASWMPSTKRRC
ncbi:probable Acetoacetyl-CoA synthetase [Ustilago trichophora]|uniref:Probable Acetoacetyl-CoA synthetase n=1 Tax=Ustilago trichophora TaxID=86804 RepID=A0A5C3EAI1_9BASI|nr:probable Acetoacetyl-CoA synthetase [Ustilago trichophora]